MSRALKIFAATIFFFTGFTIFKASMPLVMPFWADQMFASLDRSLHFGIDPWVLSHRLSAWIHADLVSFLYVELWLGLAMGFPLFLMLSDGNPRRRLRYLILTGFVWIGLGNVLALAFLSAGPVYFDRLEGLTDFMALSGALKEAGVADSTTGLIQTRLWNAYAFSDNRLGSGISAFPSVHVAQATLFAVYACERWGRLGLPAVSYLLAVLFLSVYLGWHYAIDGYVSVLLVAGAHFALLRKWPSSCGRAKGGRLLSRSPS